MFSVLLVGHCDAYSFFLFIFLLKTRSLKIGKFAELRWSSQFRTLRIFNTLTHIFGELAFKKIVKIIFFFFLLSVKWSLDLSELFLIVDRINRKSKEKVVENSILHHNENIIFHGKIKWKIFSENEKLWKIFFFSCYIFKSDLKLSNL